MWKQTNCACSKHETGSVNSAVPNNYASSVSVPVKQRHSAARHCGTRCNGFEKVRKPRKTAAVAPENCAIQKMVVGRTTGIVQMVCTLGKQGGAVASHCLTLRTSCCNIWGSLTAVVAHRLLRLGQVGATLKESGRAGVLQIRLVRFDSGPRLHSSPSAVFCKEAKSTFAHPSTLFAHLAPCKTLAARWACSANGRRCCALFSLPCAGL